MINVASVGVLIGWANMTAYCASKGGCLQLTKAMALEWVRYNIQVNAILPGYFETSMNKELLSIETGKKAVKMRNPMNKETQVEEINGVVTLY